MHCVMAWHLQREGRNTVDEMDFRSLKFRASTDYHKATPNRTWYFVNHISDKGLISTIYKEHNSMII